MTRSRKFTSLFAIGIAGIAFVYALAIHLYWGSAPYSASISAVMGSLFLSFFLWWLLSERKGKKYVSGVILGALAGSIVLLLGPIGFYAELAFEEPASLWLSYIPFVLGMSGLAFPLVVLVMYGWAVILVSVLWGGLLESLEHGKLNEVKGEA